MENEVRISELTHQKHLNENRRGGRKRLMKEKFPEEKDFQKAMATAIDKFYDGENKKIDKEILNLETPPKPSSASIKKAEAKKLESEKKVQAELDKKAKEDAQKLESKKKSEENGNLNEDDLNEDDLNKDDLDGE